MIKTDCKFYEAEIGECIALNELYCKKGNKPCSFYKPISTEKAEAPKEIDVYLDIGAKMPSRNYVYDVGYDVYSRETKIIPAMGSAEFDIGVHIDLPIGTVAYIKSNEQKARHGIIGQLVVENGETDSIVIRLFNHSNIDFKVWENDKIARLLILPVITPKLKVTTE